MRVIPVIDLLGGQVVRGIAGRRDAYRPIASQIASTPEPRAIASAFAEDFGFETAYVADLDGILRGQPDVKNWHAIASTGLKLWLDAGVGSATSAIRRQATLREAGISAELIVGLESLESAAELAAIVQVVETPPIFSLDLKAGQPLTRVAAWKGWPAIEFAKRAAAAGVRQLIVLDLADVGTSGGTGTLELCRQIRAETKIDTLIAGGGVRGPADLVALAECGVHAALVASALHDGRLSRADIGCLGSRAAGQSPTPISPE